MSTLITYTSTRALKSTVISIYITFAFCRKQLQPYLTNKHIIWQSWVYSITYCDCSCKKGKKKELKESTIKQQDGIVYAINLCHQDKLWLQKTYINDDSCPRICLIGLHYHNLTSSLICPAFRSLMKRHVQQVTGHLDSLHDRQWLTMQLQLNTN
jgi:hypothetical protein